MRRKRDYTDELIHWSWDKAPHPNPLPEGEGTREDGLKGRL